MLPEEPTDESPDVRRSYSTEEAINYLYHKLWTKAVGRDDYIKREWQDLRRLLALKGIHV